MFPGAAAPQRRACKLRSRLCPGGKTVANAIHKTESNDTLAGIAEQYYAVRRPDGAIRRVELAKVTRAIRNATGATLPAVEDTDELPAGLTLAIPTMRDLNRAVFADNKALAAELEERG